MSGGEGWDARAGAAFDRHADDVYRFCLSRLGNPTEAEDAVQETFLRATPRLSALRGEPGAYLTVVARNVCRDLRRKSAREGWLAAIDPEGAACPERQALARITLLQLGHELSRRDRLLLAYDAIGLTGQEMARRLGLTASAAGVALMRARRRAREIVVVVVLGLVAGRLARRLARGVHALPLARLAAVPDSAGIAAATVIASLLPGMSALSPGAIALLHPLPSHAAGTATAATVVGETANPVHRERALSFAAPPSPARSATPAPASAVRGRPVEQRDVQFASVAPSPEYQSDHTVFASGSLTKGCADGSTQAGVWCDGFFTSTDGGTSWRALDVTPSYVGGTVLVPGGDAAERRVFVAAGLGLERSDDGGASFRVVGPGGPAALLTDTSGRTRVFVGSNPPVLYDVQSGVVTPGPLLPTGMVSGPDQVVAAAGTVFMTGELADLTSASGTITAVLRCHAGPTCTVVLRLPSGRPSLALSPAFAADATMVVAEGTRIFTSHDGGASFSSRDTGLSAPVQAVTFAGDPAAVDLVVSGTLPSWRLPSDFGSLVRWSLGASSLQMATPQLLGLPGNNQFFALARMPDGRLLASIDDVATVPVTFGLWCSADSGRTWSRSC